MKKQAITILLLFSTLTLSAISGLTDWGKTTSSGTRFNAPGDGVHLTTKNHKVKLRDLKEWYFYNGFIIGSSHKEGYTSYFILNESSEQIKEYSLKKEWSEAIADQNLNPGFWLRKFSGNWNHIHDLSLALFFLFPVTVLVLPAQIFLTVAAVKRRKKGYIWGAAVLPMAFIVLYILSSFPQSI